MARESMRWDDVRIFLAIHRQGSMAGAARALKVDQTTIGRRLQALEEALDARLFDRLPDGLTITPAGSSILEAAERIEEGALALERRIGGEDARIAGVVRIATSEAFVSGYLSRRLRWLSERHPDLVIEIVTSQSFVALSRREADLALRQRPSGSPPAQENVMCRKIMEVAWSVYASERYVAARGPLLGPDSLEGHDVVAYDEESGGGMPGSDWLRRAAAQARVRFRVTAPLSATALARQGLGVALLPAMFAGGSPALVRLRDTIAMADGWLLVHPDLQHVARVRAVIDALVQVTKADASWMRGEGEAPSLFE